MSSRPDEEVQLQIREFEPGDEHTLWTLFHDTVHKINRQDYSLAQVRAWAPDECDEDAWRRRIEQMEPIICEAGGQIVGYAGWSGPAAIDHFYVHSDWQSRGVGKRLLSAIEHRAAACGVQQMVVEASITARSFFESQGYRIVADQRVERNGVRFRNYRMVKALANPRQADARQGESGSTASPTRDS